MQPDALTAGGVLKILARSNPQDGRGDLAWIESLAGMLDDMLQGYALVQAIDNADQLSGLPGGTDLYSSDEQCLISKNIDGEWITGDDGILFRHTEDEVIDEFGGLLAVYVPQDE